MIFVIVKSDFKSIIYFGLVLFVGLLVFCNWEFDCVMKFFDKIFLFVVFDEVKVYLNERNV